MQTAMKATAVPASKAFKGASVRVQQRVARPNLRRVAQAAVANEAVAANYATALVDVAQKGNVLEQVHTDIDALATVLKENESLKEILSNPVVREDRKKELVARLASEAGFNQYTTNFLNLLIDGSRMDVIEEICESFEVSYCALTDTQVAVLRSAVKLEQEQQFLIAKKLQELTGSKNIKLKPVIDPALVAGFVVEYGSVQIDLSVKGQLDRISSELYATASAM